jgi:hypothetical protein
VKPGIRAGCYLAAASVLSVTSAAIGDEAPPIVRVYVAGAPEAVSGSRDAIQDLCSRSNVAVVVRDAAGADEALLATSHTPGLADAYVDLREGTPPRVVVVDGQSRRDLERRTLPEGVSLEISIETMAHVVCAAVESSLAARAAPPAGTPTKAVPLSEQAEAPTPRKPEIPSEGAQRWQTRASVFGSGANFGAGFRAGLGAGFALNRGQARWHFGAFFSLMGYPAAGVESANGLASFGLLGVRALPLLEWQAARDVTAFAGVGAGGDWIRVSGERPPPGTISTTTEAEFEPVASGMLGIRLRLGRGVSALFAADVDIALVRHQYVVQTPVGADSFFEPARVRPMALAGLSLSLGGEVGSRELQTEARR